MAEQSSSKGENSVKQPREKSEKVTFEQVITQDEGTTEESPLTKRKSENSSAQKWDESAKTSQRPATKIPQKAPGKKSKKNDNSATKKTSRVQEENGSKLGENSSKINENNNRIGHKRTNSTSIELTSPKKEKPPVSGDVFKTREALEQELIEKTKQIDSLQKQLDDLQEVCENKQTNKMQSETDSGDTEPIASGQLMNSQEFETNHQDIERKIKMLSEENYELRERLLQRDVEIEKLKTANEEPKVQENILQKVLRKENLELHHEKEELKLERDRLRHLVNEKQEKAEKMVAGLKEMEEQLLKARRALEERTKSSTRLEDRLAKIDSELNKYRERYGKLEKQNNAKRPSEKSRCSRSRSFSPGRRENLENQEGYSQSQVTMLQQREARLLDDRRQLEKSVNFLTNKISELEKKLQKCRPEKRTTHERGSQTDLEIGNQLTSTVIQNKGTPGHGQGSAVQKGTTGDSARKCRGIVQTLGKFFEELILNNQDTTSGGSRSRRTTIAAQRANELLHELSVSMETALTTKSHEHREMNRSERSTSVRTRSKSPQRRTTGVNNDPSKTLWDKLCDEVAKHEFAFDPVSPPPDPEQPSTAKSDKEREVKRAEMGLQRMYEGSGEVVGENVKDHGGLTKEDATRMMNVSRKETESVVKDLLRKHQGEIRALLENACQSSPLPTVAFDISSTNQDLCGQDEATMAVKELDCFKTKTAKVQSLILKLQEVVECAKKDKNTAEQKLHSLADEIRKKDTLLQAKSLELRRRHGRTLESEKSLQSQIHILEEDKAAILKENARLHEVCRQKDLQILQKVQEIKAIQQQANERDSTHQQNLGKMRKKVEEVWGLYEAMKSRAEKRTAEFSEAAEKLKASQGHLLDLWQTLKTVDNVVEANEHGEL